MPSPTTSSSATTIAPANSQNLDALLSLNKWGGTTGTGVTLTYSFPWAAGPATFAAPPGAASYSTANEPNATYHYGLNATQQTAAQAALQSWANVANITFQQVADTATNVGDIRFAFSSAVGSAAWGYSFYPNSYWSSAGDIWISTLNSGATNPNWSVGSYNYYSLIHEVGHTLGLKHPFEGPVLLPVALDTRQYSVMSYTDPATDLFRTIVYNANGTITLQYSYIPAETPMVLDIAAIQYMYGANMTYRTGNDVYSFDPAKPFYKTIWDAGGNDTISVSNFTENCRIDLTPGSYSSIRILSAPIPAGYTVTGGTVPTYDGTNNLGIAYGAIIENATGGSGADTLIGNNANNRLDGGAGADTMIGGLGNDTYVVNNALDVTTETSTLATEIDTVQSSVAWTLGANLENLILTGVTAINGTGNGLNNTLIGNAAANILNGGAGNDVLNGGAGNDTLIGGTGIDWAYYNTSTAGVVINLALTTAQTNIGAGSDTLSGIENLLGSSYNDVLTGNSLANLLNGGAGADTMIGGLGNDTYIVDNVADITTETSTLATEIDTICSSVTRTLGVNLENLALTGTAAINGIGNTLNNILAGNAAANTLDGSAGNDILSGGAGNDTLIGGTGIDWAYYNTATAGITANLNLTTAQATGGAGVDTLSGIENLLGSSFNDMLTGNSTNNLLSGGAGADTMIGGLGNDTYIVDNTADVTTETSTLATEIDTVQSSVSRALGVNLENLVLTGAAAINGTGNALNNIITGNSGANTLNGGTGNDTLIGGLGKDTLTGSAGADIFDFNTIAESIVGTNRDVISDFLSGMDKIDLSGIDANALLAGNQAFTLIAGTSMFTGAGQVKCTGGILYCEVNGDTVADFEIALSGVTTMTSADFVL